MNKGKTQKPQQINWTGPAYGWRWDNGDVAFGKKKKDGVKRS